MPRHDFLRQTHPSKRPATKGHCTLKVIVSIGHVRSYLVKSREVEIKLVEVYQSIKDESTITSKSNKSYLSQILGNSRFDGPEKSTCEGEADLII